MNGASVVDHQSHWYPPAYLERLLDRESGPRTRRDGEDGYVYIDDLGVELRAPRRFRSIDDHLADMDAHGIDVTVLSVNLLGDVARRPVADAVQTLEFLNSEVGRVQREHPDRIIGLAMVPMQDPDAALQVLDRAASEEHLRGVFLLSNIAGRPIVSDELLPVYQRIEELGMPVFLHPSHRSVVDHVGYPFAITAGLGWMFETGAAALSLVYGRVFDLCPDLVVVHPHLGGALPAVVERVSHCEVGVDVQHDLGWYLRRHFFVDTAQQTPGAARLAIDTYGLQRVLYATDYPFLSRQESRESADALFSPDELGQVLSNTVPQLVPRRTHSRAD